MGRVAVSRMVTQRGTFVRASVSRLTICARALMRRVPYLYQRSLCRGRSRDSRGRGLTGSCGCTSSRASLLARLRLRGASGVCLDHCRKSVEAFCAEDPIPRLSDSLTCRQASCTHVSVFGGWERAGAAAPTPSAAPLGCFVQTVAARLQLSFAQESAQERVASDAFLFCVGLRCPRSVCLHVHDGLMPQVLGRVRVLTQPRWSGHVDDWVFAHPIRLRTCG